VLTKAEYRVGFIRIELGEGLLILARRTEEWEASVPDS
jgi:hypothetical protein